MFVGPLHHAIIRVSNLEKSLHFYRDILGLKILFKGNLSISNMAEVLGLPAVEGQNVMLQQDKGIVMGMIELLEITKPQPVSSNKGLGVDATGIRMLSFRVESIDRAYRYLVEKGVKFMSEPKRLDLGKYLVMSCCFLDPDDVMIELMEFLPVAKP